MHVLRKPYTGVVAVRTASAIITMLTIIVAGTRLSGRMDVIASFGGTGSASIDVRNAERKAS